MVAALVRIAVPVAGLVVARAAAAVIAQAVVRIAEVVALVPAEA